MTGRAEQCFMITESVSYDCLILCTVWDDHWPRPLICLAVSMVLSTATTIMLCRLWISSLCTGYTGYIGACHCLSLMLAICVYIHVLGRDVVTVLYRPIN